MAGLGSWLCHPPVASGLSFLVDKMRKKIQDSLVTLVEDQGDSVVCCLAPESPMKSGRVTAAQPRAA